MLAVDTNVVVRYLTGDHPEQSTRARALVDTQDVYVCSTVLLETEWVLRDAYKLAAGPLAKALRAFAGLPHVTIEDAPLAAQALDWMEAGLDFADALHLSKAIGHDGFATFDRRFARKVKRLAIAKVLEP